MRSINCLKVLTASQVLFFFSINSHLIFLHFSPKFLYFFPSSNISFWQKFPRHEIGSFSGIPVLTLWSLTIYYILFVHIKCTQLPCQHSRRFFANLVKRLILFVLRNYPRTGRKEINSTCKKHEKELPDVNMTQRHDVLSLQNYE